MFNGAQNRIVHGGDRHARLEDVVLQNTRLDMPDDRVLQHWVSLSLMGGVDDGVACK